MAKVIRYELYFDAVVHSDGKLSDDDATKCAIAEAVKEAGGTPDSWRVDGLEFVDVGRAIVRLERKT